MQDKKLLAKNGENSAASSRAEPVYMNSGTRQVTR